MELTHFGHACLLVSIGGARLLIDPGGFSEDFTAVGGLDAIIITHQHPDHLDPVRLPALAQANPDALILSDPESRPILRGLGLEAEVHPASGTSFGGVRVEPIGEIHALIHDDLPRVTNVGVRISAPGEPVFYHPGDSLEAEPGAVDILAFPLQAPWQRSRDMAAFLRRLAAPVAVPIHDRLLSPAGRDLYLGQAARLGCATTDIRDLADRGAVVIA